MTTTDYLGELISQKSALAENLVTKGVEADASEKFNTLVTKVLDIQSGGEELYFTDAGFYYSKDTVYPDNVIALGNTNCNSMFKGNTIMETFTANNITYINGTTFANCSNLTTVNVPNVLNIYSNAFYQCVNLADIIFPAITAIGDNCFYHCTALTDIVFPASLTTLSIRAFNSCSGLTRVEFKGTPTTIGGAFTNCPLLADVYVPWAEDEVAGAPWGAVNATIHYNYTESEE